MNDTTTPATYEIQNNAGTALTDADTGTAGFQVDLSVGANIIKVEVTAEDNSTETYTVTVTRAARQLASAGARLRCATQSSMPSLAPAPMSLPPISQPLKSWTWTQRASPPSRRGISTG